MPSSKNLRPLISAAAIGLSFQSLAGVANAQDDGRQIRVAVMQHDVLHLGAGDRESGLNLEVALLSRPIAALATVGRPRVYVSGSVNSDGDTNFAAVGLAWRRDLSERFSGEIQFGYALHDGVVDTINPVEAQSRLLLGSRDLFRSAFSLDWKGRAQPGYRYRRSGHDVPISLERDPGRLGPQRKEPQPAQASDDRAARQRPKSAVPKRGAIRRLHNASRQRRALNFLGFLVGRSGSDDSNRPHRLNNDRRAKQLTAFFKIPAAANMA